MRTSINALFLLKKDCDESISDLMIEQILMPGKEQVDSICIYVHAVVFCDKENIAQLKRTIIQNKPNTSSTLQQLPKVSY